jgi:hypothetical protein
MRSFVAHLLSLAGLAVMLVARGADASTLYALHTSTASGSWAVSEVNPLNQVATRRVADLPHRPNWADIAGRPDDATQLYALSSPASPGGEAVALSSIDLGTGAVSDLFRFRASDFGYASPYLLEASGLAIAASQPSVATVSATLIFGTTISLLLFDIDLETGVKSNVQLLTTTELLGLSNLIDLTYSSDGTLFTNAADAGTSTSYQISTIDRADGSVDGVESCCSADWSIEFEPIPGQLLPRQLYRAQFVESLAGDLERVHGLAFIVPEPATGALLLLGLVGYGLASNGRGGSRQGSRRA